MSLVSEPPRLRPCLKRSSQASVPQLIVHPPQEEEHLEEASLSYAAPEEIPGLPNPAKQRGVSLVCALMQVIMALPETTEELPVSAANTETHRFVSAVRAAHLDEDSDSELLSFASWALALGGLSTQGDNSIKHVEHYEQLLLCFLHRFLARTKMGARFRLELTEKSQVVRNAFATRDIGLKESPTDTSSNSLATLTSSLQQGLDMESPQQLNLSISLASHPEHATLDILTLIRSHLGIKPPTAFFFGGPLPSAPAPFSKRTETSDAISSPEFSRIKPLAASPPPSHPILFTHLPDLLVLSFQRPLTTSNSTQTSLFHRTNVEIPMEIDLGFAVCPIAMAASLKKHSANGRKGINTLYKLHGFVTQTEGRFLAYTRRQAGWEGFYKCEDEVVSEEPQDLGSRVNSKGVVFVVYRVQIGKKH
ncbi:hypothetical protein HDU98_004517 [Podochytrium sp. JEL0797]|nr:hypothetical protein HDU98_004517 [Podochytrium sp. JEL0797]